MPVQKFGISLLPEIVEQVEARDSQRSAALNKVLQRYFALMQQCRANLREQFSDNEVALILDVSNGTLFADTVSIRLLYANVEDGIQMDNLDTKWSVDGPALVRKVRELDAAHTTALVDAVEVWWERVGNGEQPQHGEALAA